MSDLDLTAVEAYLAAHLPGFEGPVEAFKYATGQSNPTFLLAAKSGRYVLRRKPPGVLLKSAHAVEREFRVQKALAGSDVPVAEMHLLCEDPDVIGTPFYVMAEVAGDHFDDPRLLELTPERRAGIFDEMARVLAALHSVDVAAVGLADYGPEGSYYARQLGRWTKQYRATETGALAEMDRLIAMLEERLPEDDGRRGLVHGDFRLDNLIFAAGGSECRAVLDWELSTLGHPFADLAGVVMQWQLPPGASGRGLAGVDRAALGLPSDAAFVARYSEQMGLGEIADFGFYLGFAFFRMAAILQGVKRRALDGNASNPEKALELGRHVPALASGGLQALRGGI